MQIDDLRTAGGLSGKSAVDRLIEPRFSRYGGYGTSWYSDPREQFTGILLTTRMMDSPQPPRVLADFWTSVYQAIDD